MKRDDSRLLRMGCLVGILGALSACDSKKSEEAVPSAPPAKAALPLPPPAAKEVAPVEPEEAPKKKEPKVCKPGTLVDFGGNSALEAQVRLKLSKPKGDVTVAELSKVRSLNLSQGKVDEL